MSLPDNGLKMEKNGLEWAKEYFEKCGKSVFQKEFPDHYQNMAFGLAGEGSECFGFDDWISTDHDYKVGFCIWMPRETYQLVYKQANYAYKKLPVYGIQPSAYQKEQGQGRHGAHDMDIWFGKFLGSKGMPKTNSDWLALPCQQLAAATNGVVFEDNLGQFTAMREELLKFYPRDVRIKKMAAGAITMAHYGQANYARMMRRNDIVAAQLCLSKFVQATMHVLYLMNKKFCPYYKWAWRGMEDFQTLPEVRDLLYKLVEAGIDKNRYEAAKWNEYQNKLNLNDPCVVLIEKICKQVAGEFRRVGLSTSQSTYLEGHAYEALLRVRDERLRNLPIMMGEESL